MEIRTRVYNIFNMEKKKHTRADLHGFTHTHTHTYNQAHFRDAYTHLRTPAVLSPATQRNSPAPKARTHALLGEAQRSVCRNRPTNEGNLSTPRSAADETIHLLGVRHRLVTPSRPVGLHHVRAR